MKDNSHRGETGMGSPRFFSVAALVAAFLFPLNSAATDVDIDRDDDPAAVATPRVPVAAPTPDQPVATGDDYDDAVILWRGFRHTWETRNHKFKRLGSYVEDLECGDTPCEGTLIHGAACGLCGADGEDSADYRTYYSEVAVNGVNIQTGYTTFTVSGNKRELTQHVQSVQKSALSASRDRRKYQVVLNGFNLCANGNSMKPVNLRVGVDEAYYDPATDKINFLVEAWMEVDCETGCGLLGDCDCGDDTFSYDLRVSYAIFAGDDELYVTREDFSRSYSWEKADIVELSTIAGSITGSTKSYYTDATLAITKIMFDLQNDEGTILDNDEAHWYIQWIAAARTEGYDISTGTMDVEVDLHFKAHDGYQFGSYRNAGSAFVQAQLALLQFRDARVTNHSVSGSYSSYKSDDACNSDSEEFNNVSFDF